MKINNKKLMQMRMDNPIKSSVSTTDDNLYLYGDIGDYWDGVTLDQLQWTVRAMDKSKVTVHINSYGGDATEGVAIRNFLRATFDYIDVIIDGIAASAASIIATCGDTLTMLTGTTYMIHNPWMIAYGDKNELQKAIGALESIEKSYIDIYMQRFKGTQEELKQLMDDESWLTVEEAEVLGFADSEFTENETGSSPDEENQLVASLFKKYVAKAQVEQPADSPSSDPQVLEDDEDPINEEVKVVEETPSANKVLNNLLKTFSLN